MRAEKHAEDNVSRAVHWSFACLLISMLNLGFYMKNTAYNADLYQLHKSIGVVFILLIVFRLYWRFKQPWRSSVTGSKRQSLVHALHLVLILLMVLMPVTGFMVSAFSGFGIHLFGVFIVPENFDAIEKIVPFNDAVYRGAKVLHNIFAYTFSLLIGGDVLAALKHHFVDKDNSLNRMLSEKQKLALKIKL